MVASAASDAPRAPRPMGIDMTVNDADGRPVSGLSAADFSLYDNGQAAPIVAFREMGKREAAGGDKQDPPTEILLVIDTINEPISSYPYIRDEVETFLKRDGGRLSQPMSIYLLNGKEADKIADRSDDGNALAATLQNADLGKRPIRHSSSLVLPRAQQSLAALGELAVQEATKPGRKIMVWIGPGWNTTGIDDDFMLDQQRNRDMAPLFETRQAMYNGIVALSTGLRQARIQLYCVKPDQGGGFSTIGWDRYKEHLKPVTDPKQAGTGDLSLQLIAVQSGGDAVASSSEFLSGVIAKTIAAAQADYFVTFETSPAASPNEYHSLKITANKPGLVVRTRAGYYNQP